MLAPESADPQKLTATTFLDEEIHALAAAGVEPIVFSPNFQGSETRHGVQVVGRSNSKTFMLRFLCRNFNHLSLPYIVQRPRERAYLASLEASAAEAAQKIDIDVVHSHFGWPGGYGGTLVRQYLKKPLVASFRGMDLVRNASLSYGLRLDKAYDAALRGLLTLADRTTYVSDFMKREGIALGADPSRAVTIPKGVDLSRFHPRCLNPRREAELRRNGKITLLAVSNLLRMKGVDIILRALASVGDSFDAHLSVIGTGPEEAGLKELTQELGVAGRVTWLGRVDRSSIPEHFAAADIFVHASHHEAAGNVLLEAMACAIPVVCTDAGGPAEYVEHGTAGFVVPTGDSQALAAAVKRLAGNEQLRKQMGAMGRQRTETLYQYETMIQRMLHTYEELLADPF